MLAVAMAMAVMVLLLLRLLDLSNINEEGAGPWTEIKGFGSSFLGRWKSPALGM